MKEKENSAPEARELYTKKAVDWILRVMKGTLIGTGFILPGVSGGALAAIFGIYERIIAFLAHLTKNFKENVFFFIPVGIGMLLGIVILSYPLGFLLENYEAPTIWGFIGCIIGTFPSLWRQSGRKGRKTAHIIIMFIAALLAFTLLKLAAYAIGDVPQNTGTWILAGVIIALGVLIPGMSPSNFLIYMGMYTDMVDSFKTLNLGVLIPIAIGGAACMLLFSKGVDWLFSKAFTGLFHIVLGVVIASTVMIVPLEYNFPDTAALGTGILVCLAACAVGVLLGLWMSGLEAKYKTVEE